MVRFITNCISSLDNNSSTDKFLIPYFSEYFFDASGFKSAQAIISKLLKKFFALWKYISAIFPQPITPTFIIFFYMNFYVIQLLLNSLSSLHL